MSEEENVETVESEIVEPEPTVEVEPEPERISDGDLAIVKNAQIKLNQVNLEAEKAVALKQIADLELRNIVLQIYNKYKLVFGQDSLTQDGTVIRAGDKS